MARTGSDDRTISPLLTQQMVHLLEQAVWHTRSAAFLLYTCRFSSD
eukprot:SAG31_NODE_14064_length_829_cov_1.080822_1_plen_45_part_10